MAGKILKKTPAGEGHQVVTVKGTRNRYCKTPCPECPWRLDTVGGFPAEAFVVSAPTSYDVPDTVMRMINDKEEPSVFACHMHGTRNSAVCAGFLLRGAVHNLAIRHRGITGVEISNVSSNGVALHENYRAMAVANGVPPDHPALKLCRDDANAEFHGLYSKRVKP